MLDDSAGQGTVFRRASSRARLYRLYRCLGKVSYFGMQTLLVLYMVHELLRPEHIRRVAGFDVFREALERVYGGPLSTVVLASAVFGHYSDSLF